MPTLPNRHERRANEAGLRALAKARGGAWTPFEEKPITPAAADRFKVARTCGHVWSNNRYVVLQYERQSEWGEITHLAIRRLDGNVTRSWADLQRIKNELTGAERTAVEVFPPESELLDGADMFHLFVLEEGRGLPFTIHGDW